MSSACAPAPGHQPPFRISSFTFRSCKFCRMVLVHLYFHTVFCASWHDHPFRNHQDPFTCIVHSFPPRQLSNRFLPYKWYPSRLSLNKHMHILIGNTATMRCETFNINGVNTPEKLQSIIKDMGEILILTETHATLEIQRGYEESLKHVHFAWAGCQTHAGVAIIARKTSFWDIKP